jgi:hypothetical protein
MPDICPSCKSAVRTDDRFCSNCARPLRTEGQGITSSVIGNHISDAIVGNTLHDSVIHVGDKYEWRPHERAERIWRDYDKPLTIFGRPINANKLRFVGGLAVLANVATIYSAFVPGAYQIIPWLLFAGSFGVCVGAGYLRMCRYLKIGAANLEVDTRDNLHLTRITGVCPRCSDKLELHRIEGQSARMLVCRRNPNQHRYTFDPTELEDLE